MARGVRHSPSSDRGHGLSRVPPDAGEVATSGVPTHFALDLLGNQYGMGVFSPLPDFYDIPVGVDVDSRWANVVALLVTGFELGVVHLLVQAGLEAQLATPSIPEMLQITLTVIGV